MHVGTDFLKLPPVTGQYWSLFQCSVLGTGGTCVGPIFDLFFFTKWRLFKPFGDLRGAKMAQNGLIMGLLKLFMHPKWPTNTFGKICF